MSLNLPGGPVPVSMFHEAVEFLRGKFQNGVCGIVQIFWDPAANGYFQYIPEQVGKRGYVQFKRNVELEARCALICEIHDHGNMPAFFSATDAEDASERCAFYVVLGHMERPMPEFGFGVFNKEKRKIDLISSPFLGVVDDNDLIRAVETTDE